MKNPDPDERITNSDEQEVAVNASTTDDGGYDEPARSRDTASTGEQLRSVRKRVEGEDSSAGRSDGAPLEQRTPDS